MGAVFIGVDEAGRGPILGPVVAGAVVLRPLAEGEAWPALLRDSKKLTSKQIDLMAEWVLNNCEWWGLGVVHADVIDQSNILAATMQAMHLALDQVPRAHILVDGNYFRPYRDWQHTCVVGGDRLHPCISAASILAKFARDAWIRQLCQQHPWLHTKFLLNGNKGYGVQMIEKTKLWGVTPWHRKSFKPCHDLPPCEPDHE